MGRAAGVRVLGLPPTRMSSGGHSLQALQSGGQHVARQRCLLQMDVRRSISPAAFPLVLSSLQPGSVTNHVWRKKGERKAKAPRSRMAAFQCSRRSLMSWFTRASRPMLRIFCVVLMLLRGLVGSHLGPPAHTPRSKPLLMGLQSPSCVASIISQCAGVTVYKC